MKSLIPAIVFSFFPGLIFCDIVYLKNGKQIECISAWEEGKEIRYRVATGIIGIPKSMVAKIEKTEVAVQAPDIPEPLQRSSTATGEKKTSGGKQSDASSRPRLADLYTEKGFLLTEKRDFVGALENFKKAYQQEKTEETALNLGLIYFALKDDFNAEFFFNEALRMNSGNAVAHSYLGEIAWKKEDLATAQAHWQKSLSIEDDPALRQKLQRLNKEQAASADYESATSRHFLLRYDGGEADQLLVRDLTDTLEEIHRDLSTQYETYPAEPFVVVLYPRQQFFNVMDLPLWSAGANDGKIKLPVKGLTSVTPELRAVLVHELSHSFVSVKTSENCPVWLQEGLAEYAEGTRATLDGQETLVQLIRKNQLPSFGQLTGSFANSSAQMAAVLYLQSLSFMEYLVDRHQFYQMNEFLDRLGQRMSVGEAFQETYLASLSEMEQQWREHLTGSQ